MNFRDRVKVVKRVEMQSGVFRNEILHAELPCMVETLEPVMAEMWKGLPGADLTAPDQNMKVACNLYVHPNYAPLVSMDDTLTIPEETHFVQALRPVDPYGTIYTIEGVRVYRSHLLYLLERSTIIELPA